MTRNFSDEDVKKAVKKSFTYSEVLRNLGAGRSGSTFMHFKKRILSLNLDTSHFRLNRHSIGRSPKTKLQANEILVYNRLGRREKPHLLRRALLDVGIKYECIICGLYNWNNKRLTLHVDHINGDVLDNRKENLRLLCHHCHSQTPNFGPKKIRKNKRPKVSKKPIKLKKPYIRAKKFEVTPEELRDLVNKMPIVKVAKIFRVSDNAIKKRCVKYGIKTKPQGYWLRKENIS